MSNAEERERRKKSARTHIEREDNNEVLLMSVGRRRRRRRSLSSRMTNLFKHTIDVKTNFSSSLARDKNRLERLRVLTDGRSRENSFARCADVPMSTWWNSLYAIENCDVDDWRSMFDEDEEQPNDEDHFPEHDVSCSQGWRRKDWIQRRKTDSKSNRTSLFLDVFCGVVNAHLYTERLTSTYRKRDREW